MIMTKDSHIVGLSGAQIIPKDPVVNTFADVLYLPLTIPFTLITSVMSSVTNAMAMAMVSNMKSMMVLPATVKSTAKSPIVTNPQILTKKPMSEYKTKMVDKNNQQLLVGTFDLIDIKNAHGEVTGLTIKAPSSDYSIIINMDRDAEYQRTWTEMSSLSDDVDDIVASLQDGSYILSMSDIHFLDNIKIVVVGKGITFSKLYAKVKYANNS